MSTRTGARADGAEDERTKIEPLRLLAALILVNGLFLGPSWVVDGGVGSVWLSLEAVGLVGALALIPVGRRTRRVTTVAAGAVVALALLGLGDAAIRLSLGRPANLYTDLWLLDSVWDLMAGMLGPVVTLLALLLFLAGIVGLVMVLGRLLGPATPTGSGPGPVAALRTRGAAALGLLVALAALVAAEGVPALAPRLEAPMVALVGEQVGKLAEMVGERERFTDALDRFPGSYAGVPGLLEGLGGRDAIFAFVESYGVTALYDPRYAPVVGPRLDDMERRLEAAGLHVVSGKMIAPSQGGQSWFGHGSLLSGLWLDNQIRYDMMLATGRETLIDDFERAGYTTVAVMPAITTAWPEGRRFGYDRIYASHDIDYAGPPLNWVTMPDQFTWSFVEREIRHGAEGGRAPLFVELGLISSHAPWTPILPVLEAWDSIGDGSVFAPWKDAGEPPEELWLDTDRVREHYALSIEYALHATVAYAERYVDEQTVLIVLGDHQPAPLVTGEEAPWEVPVHVVSGDSAVLEPFRRWGFVDGAWPDPALETLGMDYFRDWFVRAYSGS